jgi:hypothetical protein
MKSFIAALVTVWSVFGILTIGAYGALPPAHPGPTVNDYTGAESQRAEVAARRAGFDNLEITMVQDGNFFLNGQKQGETYSLTVTRDGKVYPSSPLPAQAR